MSTMTRIGRGVAVTGVAGLMSLGLATSAFADGHVPSGSEANNPDAWEAYLVEEGYENPMCEKMESGFDGDSWTSDDDYVLVVLKAGSDESSDGDPRTVLEDVEEGQVVETSDGKDISHVIACTADEDETTTPPGTTPPGTTPPGPTGPVVETDIPESGGSSMPTILGGAALLAGLGITAGAMRRKGQH